MAGDEEIRLDFEGDITALVQALRRVTKEASKALGDVSKTAEKEAKETTTSTVGLVKAAAAGVAAGIAAAGIDQALDAIKSATIGVAETFRDWADEVHGTVDTLGTLSAATGLSMETLNGLRLAAGQTNKELEDLVPMDLSKRILETAQGTGEGILSFQAYGISATDATGALRDANEVFLEVLDVLSKIENSTLRTAEAEKLLGTEGRNMFSAFSDVSDVERFIGLATEFGTQVGPDAAAASAEWWREMDTLRVAFEDLQVAVVEEFGDDALAAVQEVAVATVLFSSLVGELAVDFGRFAELTLTWASTFAPATTAAARVAFAEVSAITDLLLGQSSAWERATARADLFRARFFGDMEPGQFWEDSPFNTEHWQSLRSEIDETANTFDRAAAASAASDAAKAEREAAAKRKEEIKFLTAAWKDHYGETVEVTDEWTHDQGLAYQHVMHMWNRLHDDMGEKNKDTFADVMDTIRGGVDGIGTMADGILGILSASSAAAMQRARDDLEQTRDTIESAGGIATGELRRLEDEQKDQVLAAFRRNQHLQRVQAIIDAARSAVALIPGFAYLGPFAVPAAAAAAGAGLAASLITINSQQPPSFPTGGVYSTGGARAGHGLAYLEDGEGVASRRAMEDPSMRRLLEAANQGVRPSMGGSPTTVEVVVSYDSSARSLRVTGTPVGKRKGMRSAG